MRVLRTMGTAVALAVVVIPLGGWAVTFVAEAYPSESAKREALARCLFVDRNFVRFSGDSRHSCYMGLHVPGYDQASLR